MEATMDFAYLSRSVATAQRNRHLQKRRGHTHAGSKLWEAHEDQIIRSTAHLTIPEVRLQLPHRTGPAIERRREKLNMTRRRLKQWTTHEDRILRQNNDRLDYVQIAKLLPHRSVHAVQGRAWYLGIRKGCLHPPKAKGLLVYDEVRRRGYEDGFSMRALDSELGTGKYFQDNYRKTLNWKKLARAIDFFGGELSVNWKDD
jgi:hypothetical protein